jgi:hypothetical protein
MRLPCGIQHGFIISGLAQVTGTYKNALEA